MAASQRHLYGVSGSLPSGGWRINGEITNACLSGCACMLLAVMQDVYIGRHGDTLGQPLERHHTRTNNST